MLASRTRRRETRLRGGELRDGTRLALAELTAFLGAAGLAKQKSRSSSRSSPPCTHTESGKVHRAELKRRFAANSNSKFKFQLDSGSGLESGIWNWELFRDPELEATVLRRPSGVSLLATAATRRTAHRHAAQVDTGAREVVGTAVARRTESRSLYSSVPIASVWPSTEIAIEPSCLRVAAAASRTAGRRRGFPLVEVEVDAAQHDLLLLDGGGRGSAAGAACTTAGAGAVGRRRKRWRKLRPATRNSRSSSSCARRGCCSGRGV